MSKSAFYCPVHGTVTKARYEAPIEREINECTYCKGWYNRKKRYLNRKANAKNSK